jgi:hypothetical protein
MEGFYKNIFYSILIILLFIYFQNDYNIIACEMGLPPLLRSIPKNILYSITGNILGDGSISKKGKYKLKNGEISKRNAYYQIHIGISSYNYLKYLFDNIYINFCSKNRKLYPHKIIHKDITKCTIT